MWLTGSHRRSDRRLCSTGRKQLLRSRLQQRLNAERAAPSAGAEMAEPRREAEAPEEEEEEEVQCGQRAATGQAWGQATIVSHDDDAMDIEDEANLAENNIEVHVRASIAAHRGH